MTSTSTSFSDSITQCWASQDYPQAENLHNQAIEAGTSNLFHYWYCGLALLLQRKEEDAQMIWMLPLLGGNEEQVDSWTRELLEVLDLEASLYASKKTESAWLIRQHIREISPEEINNNLLLFWLSVKLNRFQSRWLQDWKIIEQLCLPGTLVNEEILYTTLQIVLQELEIDPISIEFLQAGIPFLLNNKDSFSRLLIQTANRIAFAQKKPEIAVQLGEICRQLVSKNDADAVHMLLMQLSAFYQEACRYQEAITTAQQSYDLSSTTPQKIVALHRCLSSQILTGGNWETGYEFFQQEQRLLYQFISQPSEDLQASLILRLMTTAFFQPYFQDTPRRNRQLQNQVMAFCQKQLRQIHAEQVTRYSERPNIHPKRSQAPIKVGYLSHCLKRHSVGWITRWLFEHHNREQVQVYLYLVASEAEGIDPMQDWFVSHADVAHRLPANPVSIADQIHSDHIDILVELDSITLDTTCAVLALKPAPIQVSWLGWDASGLPAVDYYLVDPHVVPDEADQYYTETLWRLPQTYVAVDGFEIGVPTLRRNTMDLPPDAVIYLSTQRGHKLHPETVRLQLQIIGAVPGSYLLVKAAGQQMDQKEFWFALAQEAEVDSNRLRFLPEVPSELTHRANLQLADVLLDTYPYNGATTTLETLWLELPLVTRVGQQFSARNSYTMMKNAGISEGIAWTDKEYVEWGIRLGTDESLRQSVRWKLHCSKQTSLLWDAEKFTQELETAYRQMWAIYNKQP